MAIVLQESLRALFYAPFYVALERDAFTAEGVEIRFTSRGSLIVQPTLPGNTAPTPRYGARPPLPVKSLPTLRLDAISQW